MNALPFSLERTILIRARRATVFRFFTDPARFASWWGAGSTIDPRPGGPVSIVYPNGVVARGQVVEIEADRRIVFTYGYDDPGKPIPPGGSRVTVTLDEHEGATRVHLRHDLADQAARDAHVPGWRFQLSLFANVVSAEAHAAATRHIDAWFAAWNGDPAGLAGALAPGASFHDRWACVTGLDEIGAHIQAARAHTAGTLARAGEPRPCQGSALVSWELRGNVAATGENLFELDADGKITRVVGFWR
jgi:uncharacterized protein YndB with AHSA1/START domain